MQEQYRMLCNPSCDLLDIHEYLAFNSWQNPHSAKLFEEKETHGHDDYSNLLSL